MGYLTGTLTLRGKTYHFRELTHADYEGAVSGDKIDTIKVVAATVREFEGMSAEEIAANPVRVIAELSTAVIKLSSSDDPAGNSESAPDDGSSSA